MMMVMVTEGVSRQQGALSIGGRWNMGWSEGGDGGKMKGACKGRSRCMKG